MTLEHFVGMDHQQMRSFRVDYKTRELTESEIHVNPFVQFRLWFDEAVSAGIIEPNAMVVATATSDGVPSARVVLLKAFDETGFTFYTNYGGRKGREIGANPKVAGLFYWDALEREVRLEGSIAQLSDEESDQYFAGRPRDAQIGAWASRQSRTIPSRAFLDEEIRRYQDQFGEGFIPRPPFWGGYRIIPSSFEFWQGRSNRLHDRLEYRKNESGLWLTQRLSP